MVKDRIIPELVGECLQRERSYAMMSHNMTLFQLFVSWIHGACLHLGMIKKGFKKQDKGCDAATVQGNG